MNIVQPELEIDAPSLSLELPRKSKVIAFVNDAAETIYFPPTAKILEIRLQRRGLQSA